MQALRPPPFAVVDSDDAQVTPRGLDMGGNRAPLDLAGAFGRREISLRRLPHTTYAAQQTIGDLPRTSTDLPVKRSATCRCRIADHPRLPSPSAPMRLPLSPLALALLSALIRPAEADSQ